MRVLAFSALVTVLSALLAPATASACAMPRYSDKELAKLMVEIDAAAANPATPAPAAPAPAAAKPEARPAPAAPSAPAPIPEAAPVAPRT